MSEMTLGGVLAAAAIVGGAALLVINGPRLVRYLSDPFGGEDE